MLLTPLLGFALLYAGHIGTDTPNYKEIFLEDGEFQLEPGFSLMMLAANALGADYTMFSKALVSLQILLLAFIVFQLRDPLIFLLLYTSTLFLHFQFNAVRNGLALLLVGAFYAAMRRPSIIWPSASGLVHYSGLFSVAVQHLAASRQRMLSYCAAAIASASLVLIWLSPQLAAGSFGKLSTYQEYLLDTSAAKVVYPALLVKLIFVGVLFANGGNKFYFIAYSGLVILTHSISPVISRLCDLVLFLATLDFCLNQQVVRLRPLAIALSLVLAASNLVIVWRDCRSDGPSSWCIPSD